MRRNRERGVVILLVAVVLLFVVGAMAALAIDLVAFYTARSEAQLAADGAALAGARVLANSGFTSGSVDQGATEDRARAIANQVATSNKVGGRTLVQATEVTVTFNDADPTFATNPHVTVKVQRTDLPTFFAHIWGRATVSVGASATAEAYNPSGADAFGKAPVAPTCVKPWLLPNIDPTNSPNPIFVTDTGVINNPALLGYSTTSRPPTERLRPRCIDCSVAPLPTPVAWHRGEGGAPHSIPHSCAETHSIQKNANECGTWLRTDSGDVSRGTYRQFHPAKVAFSIDLGLFVRRAGLSAVGGSQGQAGSTA